MYIEEDRFANYDFNSKEAAEEGALNLNLHPTEAVHSSGVDWAVSMIFWNAGNKNYLTERYLFNGASQRGTDQWGALNEGAGAGWQTQSDPGVKTHYCTGGGIKSYHMRLYGNGSTPSMFNRKWKYYVIGTTHRDVGECSASAWFGESEESEHWFANKARDIFGDDKVAEDYMRMYNRQGWPDKYRVGDHEWHNDGRATMVFVPRHGAHAASAPPPPPENPPPPPPTNTPIAQTTSTSSISQTQATLNGTVDPEGSDTEYYFEYGKTTAYGSVKPIPHGSAGSGTVSLSFSAVATGLEPATTYHYQIVASNESGTGYGADRSFTTAKEPNYIALATSSGQPWLKYGLPGGTWVPIGDTDFAVRDMKLEDDRLVLAKGDGSVWYKENLPAGPWQLLFGPEYNAQEVDISGNRIAVREGNGEIALKEGLPGGPITVVRGAETGVRDMDLDGDRLVVDSASGAVWLREGLPAGSWQLMFGSEFNAKQAEISANRIAVVNSNGSVWMKEGLPGGAITLIRGNLESGLRGIDLDSNRLIVNDASGAIWLREGLPAGSWQLMFGSEFNAKQAVISGNRIAVVNGDGSLWMKEGLPGGPLLLMGGVEFAAQRETMY